ncbi:MAG: response regulator, partial [Bacteroidetes bacterium]|nr:response regulator [Bacteroidota bacterium]
PDLLIIEDPEIETSPKNSPDSETATESSDEKAASLVSKWLIPRILLVEDNKINQRIAILHLEKMGYEISLAENGQEAFDQYKKGGFDLIFMDIQMPIMDGYETTRQIRKYEQDENRESGIYIIAMTANAMKGDREACLDVGMNDYISKPFKAEELKHKLEQLFRAGE